MQKNKCQYCKKNWCIGEFCSVECMNQSEHTKICKTCRKSFAITPSGKSRKYCSRECSKNKQTQRIKKQCEQCQKEMTVYPYEIDTKKYCSPKCNGLSKKTEFLKLTCLGCGMEFATKNSIQSFCSSDCCKKNKNSVKERRRKPEELKKIGICGNEQCKKEFEILNKNHKYCSYGCAPKKLCHPNYVSQDQLLYNLKQ